MNVYVIAKSIAITAVSFALLAGCSSKTVTSEGKLDIVTSFYPMYEFTKQIAGEHANVIALVPAGTEPHDWEPSAKDMKKVKEADVFVYNGLVEGWAEQALQSAANSKRVVIEASKGIALMQGATEEEEDEDHEAEHDDHAHDEHSHDSDPHVWLDPTLAQQEVEAIAQGLIQADPAHQADYREHADAYIGKLKALDEAFRATLANVKNKEFVTQHAAFGYLAKAYGLTQIPISGLSPEEEPSPAQMADIIQFAKEKQVKTIFFETLVDPKVAATIAKEINAKTDVLNPLEGLTAEDKKNNLDYIGVMTNNLHALKKALDE
ncbi:metal ABC transporter substrate-binding protein [Paenibacillus qinlingensis]|uniref:Zinc transport system substrate-binding protein n=1 Tax=Paenibacillus qinlingensis TaxID=1837343 RepID=A0ABU1NR87_9BACL|nr:metal ABC transporter substrate-binding protein [Paenibacillus qinlingensis]MDR6550005.1 zinc transport system substrate-binding protein [Paenibacillus qinlingensis]